MPRKDTTQELIVGDVSRPDVHGDAAGRATDGSSRWNFLGRSRRNGRLCFRSFRRATAVALMLLVCSQTLAMAITYYVAPHGNDENPGTQTAPFRTVPQGLARAGPGDTVFIESGTYDLAGFATTVDHALTLTGEDKSSTVLTNGGTLTFSKSLTVENVTFRNWRSTVLKPSAPEGRLLDGVVVRNCIFENLASAINAGKEPRGVITNVKIANCEFRNMEGNGVAAISIAYGVISNVQVTDNTFRNLKSTTKGCSAVVVGSNATRATTKDILISENEMDTIWGPTVVVDGAGPEVHGILAYGTNVRILKNIVRNLNAGTDHEAIYMKASHSVIGDNVVENCGSGGGGADITSKGGEASDGNVNQREPDHRPSARPGNAHQRRHDRQRQPHQEAQRVERHRCLRLWQARHDYGQLHRDEVGFSDPPGGR